VFFDTGLDGGQKFCLATRIEDSHVHIGPLFNHISEVKLGIVNFKPAVRICVGRSEKIVEYDVLVIRLNEQRLERSPGVLLAHYPTDSESKGSHARPQAQLDVCYALSSICQVAFSRTDHELGAVPSPDSVFPAIPTNMLLRLRGRDLLGDDEGWGPGGSTHCGGCGRDACPAKQVAGRGDATYSPSP